MHTLANSVRSAELVTRVGYVASVRGHVVECVGPVAQIGERCRIGSARSGAVEAEVIGFGKGTTILMTFGGVEGVAASERVEALGQLPDIPVGPELLGRVIDAFGRPADGGAPLGMLERRSLQPPALLAMHRRRIDAPIETGIKVIDSVLTLAKGQRVGLFAGSGVGKTTLMGMMVRGTRVDVNVIALIGERSREVREFVEDQLGPEGLQRSVVIVATAAEPAVLRLRAAHAATTIAEYFRDRGEDVMLVMDSLTRFAMARREVGLAVGEPPTARGYTPSVFSELPQLCERSGPGTSGGSITGVYTVLVDGDDMNEPVADTLRATLDGHIVLSRDIANAGQYPAVDVLNSISRLHAAVGLPEQLAATRRVLACCALFERNRQLIEIGAYKPGVSAALDCAVRVMPAVLSFFAQTPGRRVMRSETLAELQQLAALLGADDESS
jgi:flagellum-specific ATP synthase